MRRFGRWVSSRLGRAFPRETKEPRTVSGYATSAPLPWWYWAAALALPAVFAAVWLWTVQAAVLPPGTDESTWLLTSYAYLGVPVPALATPGVYPPASFPLLTLAVIAGGGPVWGSRIFTVCLFGGVGLSTFTLGRTLVRFPAVALLAEGLFLAEPDFTQIYYFAGYPNLVAFIAFVLSLAYLVRFLRSRNGTHAIIFWTALMVCVLSHSLTAVFLAATIGLFLGALLIAGRLPRTILWSRAGAIGAAIAAVGIGGYYGSTYLLGIQHPAYLDTGPVGATKIQLIPNILRPYYLPVIVNPLTQSTFSPTVVQTVEFFGVATAIVLAAFVLARIFRPAWLTTPWLLLAAWMLSVWVGTLAGYWRTIDTDYRRFAYFLYLPNILVVLFALDIVLVKVARGGFQRPSWLRGRSKAAPPSAPPRPGPLPPGRSRRRWIDPLTAVAAVALVLGAGYFYTQPTGVRYEAYFAHLAHDTAFVDAMNAISNTGIPGSILSTTPADGHWPSAVTQRAAYSPSASGANQFGNTLIEDSELSGMTLGGRYIVNNGLVAGTVPGVMPGQFNASMIYSVFAVNVVQSLLELSSSSLAVQTTHGSITNVVPIGAGAPAVTVLNGGLGYQIVYVVPGVQIVENVTPVPGISSLVVTFNATATTSDLLTMIQVRVAQVGTQRLNLSSGPAPGEFVSHANTLAGFFNTSGNVTPALDLSKVILGNNTTAPSVLLRATALNATAGTPSLEFSLNLSTPGASNAFSGLPTWVTAPSVWQNFSIRFVVDYNSSAGLGPIIPPYYFIVEYGAAVLTVQGPWTILVLPQSLAGPPDPAL